VIGVPVVVVVVWVFVVGAIVGWAVATWQNIRGYRRSRQEPLALPQYVWKTSKTTKTTRRKA